MIDDLQMLLFVSQNWLIASFVVFVRVAAMMSLAPIYGEKSVPIRVKLAVSFAFTLIVTPGAIADTLPPIVNLQEGLRLLAPEVLTGLFFGAALRFFMIALQVAGSMAAQATSLAQIFGGSAGADPQPAIGHLLIIAGLALAAIMGIHVYLASYIMQSYIIVPVGVLIDSESVISLGVQEVGRAFRLGFCLAGPFLIASFIYNITLGVINKAMPQLMVSFVGAPAITAGALLLLALSAPLMIATWLDAYQNFMADPYGSIR